MATKGKKGKKGKKYVRKHDWKAGDHNEVKVKVKGFARTYTKKPGRK